MEIDLIMIIMDNQQCRLPLIGVNNETILHFIIFYPSVYFCSFFFCNVFLESGILYMHAGGKRDEGLILPVNSSLSATLHQNQVSSFICFFPEKSNDCFIDLSLVKILFILALHKDYSGCIDFLH